MNRHELLQGLRAAGFQSYNLEIGFDQFEEKELNNTGADSAEFKWRNEDGQDASISITRTCIIDEELDQGEYFYQID